MKKESTDMDIKMEEEKEVGRISRSRGLRKGGASRTKKGRRVCKKRKREEEYQEAKV